MFQRLHEFSQCLPERPAWQRLNEGMQPPYDRGLALCFDASGEWAGVAAIYDDQSVVYRSGPPRGTDLTPCCKLAGDTADRLCRAAQALVKRPNLTADQRSWLQRTITVFQEKQAEFWAEVETASKQAGVDGKDHRGYVYWCRKDGPHLEPVYAWSEAKDFLVAQFLEAFVRGGKRSGVCAVCDRNSVTVYGNFSVLACYNLDKPGSIAGGFRTERAHRNLPVCETCALALAETFNFADTRLKSSMGGQPYLILPYANNPVVRAELKLSLENHPDQFVLGKGRDLLADQWALVDEFAGCGDQLAFALVFFKEEQASWRIQAEVQHLLPSRIKELHEAGRNIETADDLATEQPEGIKPLRISAQTFRNFAGAGGKTSADTLRAWLVALFDHRPVDTSHFLHCLVDNLVTTGKTHPEYLNNQTRQAWGLYRYALLTGLIQITATEDSRMAEVIPDSPYGRYIAAHHNFFCKPELAVAFLTGCYAATVASVQRKERNADPFTKKFMGRLLSRDHLRRLYREGHGKLAQYGKLGYVIQTLDPDLANAWISCGDRWAVSDEEATFAFTIGYSLSYRIQKLDSETSDPSE
ncbi:MAG: TM1802 family CRISPR-associated protein [Candidatus Competibacter sp.]|nr:TM1802 family CRISPR-associated protein [Candidatus Competibacter sp.]